MLVTSDGLVLTAKHVVYGDADAMPSGTECTGAIGNANRARNRMFPQDSSLRYDAILMKYPDTGLPFQRYCRLEPRSQRAWITATGFPLSSRTGVPSSRVGVLSTVQPDSDGVVETDSATTVGMSGGMVTLAENGNLIGIVSGQDPDFNGLPANYRVLSAQVLASEFEDWGFSEDEEGCAARARVTPMLGSVGARPWEATDDALPLEFSSDEGVCYIVSVWGYFDDPKDRVEVTVEDGEYFLRGDNGGSGPHGAFAQCMRF